MFSFPEANRLTVHILAAVAEHEASMISSRTKAALQAAKARGRALGGQRGSLRHMRGIAAKGTRVSASVRQQSAAKRRDDLLPVIEDLRSMGVWIPPRPRRRSVSYLLLQRSPEGMGHEGLARETRSR
jgi:DNA invertase Pin-like site-specific DNA recombinase